MDIDYYIHFLLKNIKIKELTTILVFSIIKLYRKTYEYMEVSMNKYFKMAILLLFIFGFSFFVSCNKDKPSDDDGNTPTEKRNIY